MKKKLLPIYIFLSFLISPLISIAQPHWKDVANIIYTRCGNCHNPNTHGDNFMGYSFVAKNAMAIKNEVQKGTMPPWLPDTTYGTRFVNEYIITAAEKSLLLKWIDNGFPAGDTSNAPKPPAFGRHYIKAKADIEVSIGNYKCAADKEDQYICFAIPTGLTEDRVLKAAEVVAGNPAIVHHVLVGVDTTGKMKSDFGGSCFQVPGDYMITGFAPGALPTIFPSHGPLRAGIRIKAGSKIVFQIHYPQKSAGKMDSTKVRLFFYPRSEQANIRHVYVETMLQKWFGLNIPANKITEHKENNAIAFATGNSGSHAKWNYDASLLAVFPHSHAICTFIENTAVPGTGTQGKTIPLVKINKWDFNREGFFTYRKLLKIPKGYHLEAKHIYDNTEGNFANPNKPPKDISAGPATKDEMLFDSFQWLKYQPGDENINIDSIIKTDPLVSGFYEEAEKANFTFKSYSFPNPFKNTVTIGYELEKASTVELTIWTVTGQVIKSYKKHGQPEGRNEIIWDGTNNEAQKVAPGHYIYTIKAGDKFTNGRVAFMP